MSSTSANEPEIDALLGAYALDALDPDERDLVDAYIARNPSARAEIDELRESAAALALAPVDDTTAPAGLWDRISESIDLELEAGPDAGDADELAVRRRNRSTRWMTAVAAAAAIIAIALTTQVVSLHNRLDRQPATGERNAAAAFVRAEQVSGARKLSLKPANGAAVARVVLLPDGSGYLKSDTLAGLDAQHTYQLWALTGTATHPVAISEGVLGPHPKAAAFRAPTQVNGFAITVERSPGVAQSSQPAFASAALS